MQYRIGEKSFSIKSDFTFEELEWLDIVLNRLTPSLSSDRNPSDKGEGEKKNGVHGSFTRDEIEKTLEMILEPHLTSPLVKGRNEEGLGFGHDDFMQIHESQAVKIIADFFLQRAVLGLITSSSSVN